ncbi:MAG: ribbon-helix-helix domain-containing protein [Nitrososphaerota archaeon]
MKSVTVYLPESYLEILDELVRRKIYPNRAEIIRVAVRDLIQSEAKTLLNKSGLQQNQDSTGCSQ